MDKVKVQVVKFRHLVVKSKVDKRKINNNWIKINRKFENRRDSESIAKYLFYRRRGRGEQFGGSSIGDGTLLVHLQSSEKQKQLLGYSIFQIYLAMN